MLPDWVVPVLLTLGLTSILFAVYYHSSQNQISYVKHKTDSDKTTEQKTIALFMDHVYLTRMFMTATLNNLDEQKAVEARLIANQKQIGNLFENYGSGVVTKVTTLFTQHILIAGTIVLAYKEKRNSDAEAAVLNWNQNALDISNTFCELLKQHQPDMVEANSSCVANVQAMMNAHLAITTQELTTMLQNNSVSSMISLDEALEQAKMMAMWISDMLLN
jgi:hypothetical protein